MLCKRGINVSDDLDKQVVGIKSAVIVQPQVVNAFSFGCYGDRDCVSDEPIERSGVFGLNSPSRLVGVEVNVEDVGGALQINHAEAARDFGSPDELVGQIACLNDFYRCGGR